MKRFAVAALTALCLVLVAGPALAAAEPPPTQVSLDQFSLDGPRAFFVGGAESALPVYEVEPADNEDPIGCQAVLNMRCARSGSSAVCINSVDYLCDDCVCSEFVFP